MGLFNWLFGKKSSNEENEKLLSEANETIEQLKLDLAKAKQSQSEKDGTQIKEVEAKYKSLLAEANAQIKKLDEQLANSLNGKLDETVRAQIADAEDLKKKIKDLEEDLEEALEDAEDYKKKWKKSQTETEGLQSEVSKLNSSNKELTDELKRAKDELIEMKKDLELKMKSLSFVQEVLTATSTKEASLVKLYDRVDDVKDYVLNDFRDCVTSLYQRNDLWDYFFGSGLDYWDAVARKKWIQGKTTIAFVGEFSAGKTSIVNRVLSQDQPEVTLLPVSAKATTAVPTYITGGPGVSYNFVSADNTLKTIRESTFKEVSKEVLGQIEGISSLIKYFVMQYKNPFLNSISILDTPGFNSNDPEDAERTISVINECDALFWVIDVNAGSANRSSLSLINKHLQKPLYIIINQIDTKSKPDVDKVEQLIKKQFETEGIKVNGIVRFSKKEPLKIIMDAIKNVPQNTNNNYLNSLKDWIPDLLGVYEEEVRKASAECQEKDNNAKTINDQFYKVARTTQNRCYEAKDIPQLTDRILLDNIYKMSESKGRRLISLLNEIADNDINNMWNAFNKSYDAAQEVQQAYANLAEIKYSYQRISECAEQLKKRLNEYENLIKKG